MPLSRQLLLIIGLILILAMALWLIDGLQRLYWQLSYTSPFLAAILVLLMIALVGLLIFAFLYYNNIFRLGGSVAPRQAIEVPPVKTDAAEATLKAVQQQVAQIQDEVARQALLQRSRQIALELERGELRVVVFGTGSAGKTSLINALFGRMVGTVGAPMGTTVAGATYRLELPGLSRSILITDTPGILEAGELGQERGQAARQWAVDADLLLFVTDNDLRRSEFIALEALVAIGKRSLLVFNKSDRYSEVDQAAILGQLRERVRGFMAPLDVVSIAAYPDALELENGVPYQPEPDIMPLIRRMAIVLRAEGEDLMADNILLQSQRLGEEARKLIDGQRRRQADKVVEQFQWISAGIIAVTPLPFVDLLGTAAVNAQMVVELGRIYGCELNLERGRELALSLAKTLAGLGLIKGSTQLIATSLQLNLATMVISRAIQGITAAYLTYIAGRSFIEYFRQNQDWGDGGMTEVVQRQFQLNRRDEFLKSFIQDAMTKVIQPLAESLDRSPQGNTTQASAAMLQATETRILPATTRPVVNLSPDLSAVDLSAVDLSPTENGDWNLSDRFTADWDD
ncbi:MAG: YcjF family protein [Prochlorotrichaceae cyanobacterium]